MQGQLNPKIVGATIIGFALVIGAFTISSMMRPHTLPQQAAVQAAAAPERVSITVADADQNGIEDWRDDFVTSEPVILNTVGSAYEPPDTLTGKMSVNFLESVIRSKYQGPFAKSKEEVIASTVQNLAQETEIDLYDTPDISIMKEWDDEDIRNYANTVAATLLRNSIPNMEGELTIMYDIITNEKPERVADLEKLAGVYQGYRDDTLKIPVPAFLVKEHLDLINSYHAIHEDITAMTLAYKDPAVTLLRLKRYQDDATGLGYALQNMYFGIEPYSELIKAEDPAALFVIFSPDVQLN